MVFESFGRSTGSGVDRDIGDELFSGDYGGFGLQFGDEVHESGISKYIRYDVDMKFDNCIR